MATDDETGPATGTDGGPDDDGAGDVHPGLSEVTRRGRRVEREAVEEAYARLAARGELTPERAQVVATLAARLRARLVDGVVATVEDGTATDADGASVDSDAVAALFSE